MFSEEVKFDVWCCLRGLRWWACAQNSPLPLSELLMSPESVSGRRPGPAVTTEDRGQRIETRAQSEDRDTGTGTISTVRCPAARQQQWAQLVSSRRAGGQGETVKMMYDGHNKDTSKLMLENLKTTNCRWNVFKRKRCTNVSDSHKGGLCPELVTASSH